MIALDVETSGLDPEKASILSIGAIDIDERTNQFYEECRVWDGAQISDEALAVNGFTREQILDAAKKSESDLVKSFVQWVTDRPKNRTIVGQNSFFDREFIDAACARAGIASPLAHRTLDTHTLVWMHMMTHGITPPTRAVDNSQQSAITLTTALEYCGLPPEGKPHNALNGAFAHAEIFSRIAYNKKMLADYFSYEIPWQK
jgi:DNA polymerase III epsilon subunit-like protein